MERGRSVLDARLARQTKLLAEAQEEAPKRVKVLEGRIEALEQLPMAPQKSKPPKGRRKSEVGQLRHWQVPRGGKH